MIGLVSIIFLWQIVETISKIHLKFDKIVDKGEGYE